jgi:O-Antigen ligase
MNTAARLANGALLLLPGALTAYLSFNAGGFYPNTVGFAAVILAMVLALRILVAERPFQGLGPRLAVAAAALALLCVWTLLSALWSDSTARALLELNRLLLYLLALLLFGTIGRSSARFRLALWGLALGILVVCAAGWTTRALPDVWPVDPSIANNRLSYPLTYWNSLGLLASLGVILCFHLTSSRGQPPVIRVLGAAAIPLLAATVFFTFSRGAIVAGIAGLLGYMLFGRPGALLSGLIASVPATAIAVVVAYHADLLATPNPTTPAAVSQGQDVALAVALCAAGAALLRSLLLPLDRRLNLPNLTAATRQRILGGTAAFAVIVAITITFALDVPSRIENQYDRFVHGGGAGSSEDFRTRLTDPANNGRLGEWEVALDGFRETTLHGQGAGTYQVLWTRYRPPDLAPLSVRDAHSLYLEMLGELGLVGIVLLATALGAIVAAALLRRRRHRTLYTVFAAAVLTWLLHAGVDWDWEMPAVTLWLFALGGMVLAERGRDRLGKRGEAPSRDSSSSSPSGGYVRGRPSWGVRTALATATFAVAVLPALLLISETRLDDSARAFQRGDCREVIESAESSSSILGARPEPYEMVAYCELQGGSVDRGVTAMENAVDRDPDNWVYRYGLALARGASGSDPRPQARIALALNPLNLEARGAVRRFRGRDARRWRRQARSLLAGALPFYLSDR